MGLEKCLPPATDYADMGRCFFHYYTFHVLYPSYPAAWAFAGLFAAATVLMLVLTLRYKSRYMWIVVVTGLVEVVGYVTRVEASQALDLGLFIASTLLLLMAPIALALVNYTVVGKLLMATGKSFGCLQPKHVTRLFLASDVITFFIQGGGGGMMAIADKATSDAGQVIVLLGLGIQLVFFAAFLALTITIGSSSRFGLSAIPSLRPVFTGLYVTLFLLFVRNVFRCAEFASGVDGPAATEEWMFYVFEAAAIWLAFLAYAYWHFGRLLPDDPDAPWRKDVAVVMQAHEEAAAQAQAGHGKAGQGAFAYDNPAGQKASAESTPATNPSPSSVTPSPQTAVEVSLSLPHASLSPKAGDASGTIAPAEQARQSCVLVEVKAQA